MGSENSTEKTTGSEALPFKGEEKKVITNDPAIEAESSTRSLSDPQIQQDNAVDLELIPEEFAQAHPEERSFPNTPNSNSPRNQNGD